MARISVSADNESLINAYEKYQQSILSSNTEVTVSLGELGEFVEYVHAQFQADVHAQSLAEAKAKSTKRSFVAWGRKEPLTIYANVREPSAKEQVLKVIKDFHSLMEHLVENTFPDA
ncbi:hypothetical protein AB0L66_11545 [Streptomyces sp. NPDC052207]|uniref:hypothetical protein n=1 Tax=Streptomyces sp. NPDC052207 TaxID=3155418 RepID=UPI00343180A2